MGEKNKAKNRWKKKQKKAWIQASWFKAQNICGKYHFWAWKAWFQASKMHKKSMEHSFKLRIEFLMFRNHRVAQEGSEAVQERCGKVEEDLRLTWKRVRSGHQRVHGWLWKGWGWPRGSWGYMGWGWGDPGGFRLIKYTKINNFYHSNHLSNRQTGHIWYRYTMAKLLRHSTEKLLRIGP